MIVLPTDEEAQQKDMQERAEVLSVAMAEMRMAHERSKGDNQSGASEDGFHESKLVMEWVQTIAAIKEAGY